MTTQYLRKVSLVVGQPGGPGLDLSDLQFRFRVNRGDIQTPNSLEVRVYNLSEATVKQLQTKEFTQVVFQGGYEDNFGVLFNGTIKYKYRGHETNIDSYLDIIAADGDSAYNFAVVNASLAAGSKPTDHLKIIAKAMQPQGVTLGSNQPPLNENALPRGKVFFGMAKDHLRNVANTNNATWSIQDNKLQLILKTSYQPGDAIVLNSATGLIGFPEQTQNGIRMRTLLNPSIKVGSRIQIDNESLNQFHLDVGLQAPIEQAMIDLMKSDDGFYKVLVSEHHGDTRGNAYYTDLTCIGVNASIPPGSPLIYKAAVAPYA